MDEHDSMEDYDSSEYDSMEDDSMDEGPSTPIEEITLGEADNLVYGYSGPGMYSQVNRGGMSEDHSSHTKLTALDTHTGPTPCSAEYLILMSKHLFAITAVLHHQRASPSP